MEKVVVTKKYKIMNIINVACLILAALLNIVVAYAPMPKPLGIVLSVVVVVSIGYAIVFNLCVVVLFFKDRAEEKREAEKVEEKAEVKPSKKNKTEAPKAKTQAKSKKTSSTKAKS